MSKHFNFDEPTALNSVAEFHYTFNMPIPREASIPSKERCDLRVNLLSEELDELKAAIDDGDLIEIADALCDLQYVLSGAIIEFGLADKFKSLFDEVQRSNMSKTCKSEQEAIQTQEYYKKAKNTSSFIKEKEGEYLVFRDYDEKVLKSVNYSPADLESIVCE